MNPSCEYGLKLDLENHNWIADNAPMVLDAVVDSIITINANGQIETVNQAWIDTFGYAEDEIKGMPVSTLMPEPHRSAHQQYVKHFLSSHQAKIIGIGRELEAIKKNGSVFPIYLAVSEVKTADGTFFVGIIRDLTAQKAAEHALLEQKENLARVGRLSTMGEMTASIAHEVNQPLTAIAMYAQASLRLLDTTDPVNGQTLEKVKDALSKLNQQSLRAGAVIERIQRFVNNVGGGKELLNLNQLLKDLEPLIVTDTRLHGIELKFELDSTLPVVWADPIQIQQVVINLIRNAVDAMVEIDCVHGSTITLCTSAGENICIEVIDCGSGVNQDMLGQVFTAFQSTKEDGMGMGLAICNNIINEHGGSLQFQNLPSHGARFYFTLPLTDEPTQ